MMLHFLLPWLTSTVLHAGPLLAYESPEEALLQQQMQTYITNYVPPNTRRVREIADESASARSAQHPSTVFDPNLESNAALLPSASAASSAAGGVGGTSVPSGTTDPAMLRLLERLQTQEDLRTNSIASQQSNPLAPTGMAEIAVAGVVVAAMAFTLLRARRKRI